MVSESALRILNCRYLLYIKIWCLTIILYLIGEKERLKGKGLYFVRTTPPGKPVNPNMGNDNDVLFGEISEHTVTSLNVVINNVFKPLVDRLEPADGGVCEEE